MAWVETSKGTEHLLSRNKVEEVMHLVICTRTGAYVINDRRGTLLESIRRFINVLGRFFPETTFENCEWRSTLAGWPEVDAYVGVPEEVGDAAMATVVEVFIHYFLESATMQKPIRGQTPLELALGRAGAHNGHLVLTSHKSLRFDGRETFALVRLESLYPLNDVVENLDRQKFQGLACLVAKPNEKSKENHESTK
jgi:hypothetical protein